MASAVAFGSKMNLFFHNHASHRRRRYRYQPEIMASSRRSRLSWGAPSFVVQPRVYSVFTCSAGDDGSHAEINPATDIDMQVSNSSASSGEGYIGLFVQMLGLNNDPLDREQAVVTLWKFSDGGKDCIDCIMKFPGCVNLVLNLLKSDKPSTCEAAAGLLRNISSVKLYRDMITESGTIEEISWLLHQSVLITGVKEQSLYTLWNLSIDEKPRIKIANDYDLLSVLIKLLHDEEIKVKEAAGGVLANLSLSPCNHRVMVEAGVIPKLASLFKSNAEGFKVIRKAAKTALLELSKDDYYRVLIIEEGLIRIPLIGPSAYKSFKPQSHSWPSLPDGTELERISRPSRYGATELLLGLSVREKNIDLEETKMNAIVGRSQQQFLARIGAMELEEGIRHESVSSLNQGHTLLPCMDGVARLVLVLGLDDTSAITRAAHSIADASINEHMRISFKEAGAVKRLVHLLSHDHGSVQESVANALDRLSLSFEVRRAIEAEGVMRPLVNIVKHAITSESLLEKTVNTLQRILDPGKDMERKLHRENISISEKSANSSYSSSNTDELLRTSDTSSMLELISRERVIDHDVIKCLIKILKTSPNLQTKTASILEFLSNFEPYMMMIIASDIESGLLAVFQPLNGDGFHERHYIYFKFTPEAGTEDGVENQAELNALMAEEAGLTIAASARFLTKLLDFEQFCRTLNTANFESVLRKILRSNIPLHAKEWVAACLVKLESKAASSLEIGRPPIDLEVTIYETIPRLVEQIRMSVSLKSQEAAAIELKEVISRGGVECSKAVAATGAIFPLVKLIEEGSGNSLEACLSILYNLSMDDENHPAMVVAGSVPVLKRIVLSEGPQWTRALQLLRKLPT